MADKIRLLLACSEPDVRNRVSDSLDNGEFETLHAATVRDSSTLLAHQPVSLIFCEDALAGGGFRPVLNEVKRLGTCAPLVVLSRTGEWEEYLAALRLGAFDMVIAPFGRPAIRAAAYSALHESRAASGAVETLPRIAPKGALRTRYADAGPARHGSGSDGDPTSDSLPRAEPDYSKRGG